MNVRGRLLDLSMPRVMGVLNLTPDSFYDGGRYNAVDAALKHCSELLEEGATIIDLGAYSSRPGAEHISEQEELDRLIPVVEAIAGRFPEAIVSADTFRSGVAKAAVEAGAAMVNDISGGEADPGMFTTVGVLGVPYVLMHMRGTPQTMAAQTDYSNLFEEVCRYFAERVAALTLAGVNDVILDPGFGFAKNRGQSFELLNRIADLRALFGLPVLAGVSRKSMIYKFLGIGPADALNGTTVLNTVALMNGASILRVHDAREALEAIKLVTELKR